MDNQTFRPLIYADIDLNIIDGSAIWVTSILETMAQDHNIHPTILLKRPVIRDILVSSFDKYPNITIIDPWSKDFRKMDLTLSDQEWKRNKRLTVEAATEIMDQLDKVERYDMFLVRGYSLAKEIAFNYTFSERTWFYLTDFPQNREDVTEEDLRYLETIYTRAGKLALQTPVLIQYFKELLNIENEENLVYLPPMVPNFSSGEQAFINKHNKLIYAGKFAPFWKCPEMFSAFQSMDNKDYSFVVIGDKFHNFPKTDNYKENVSYILENTPNIFWKKGLSRKEVQQEIRESDLGVSWRHEILDESKELSTKVLEFGLHGKPVIINKNPLHVDLFGSDYPFYANSQEEFLEKIDLAFSNPEAYKLGAERINKISKEHTFENVLKFLKPKFLEMRNKANSIQDTSIRKYEKVKVLFAGHDLKFAQMLINYFSSLVNYEVKIDQWKGHNSHDPKQSESLKNWADVVIAEWGLGNAVWYSKNKKQNQKLIVRMHLQEKNTEHPPNIVWKNVDQLIFIAPGLKKEMEDAFSFLPSEKIRIIYNLVDTNVLDKPKLPHHAFNLGLMGISPSRKRLDIALSIFEQLWRKDHRYTLFIKGHLPNKYAWLWNRKDERDYYEEQFRKINSSPWRDSVVFEGWGEVSEWYRKLGFVISPSDFESFHLAVAEGMASGCIPIIRDWHGSKELYPDEYIFHETEEAVSLIQRLQPSLRDNGYTDSLKKFIRDRYDKRKICKEWEEMIEE